MRQEKLIKDNVYSKDKYKERLRLTRSKYVVVDTDNKPVGDHNTVLRRFVTYFDLGPKNYFGGRVLISESSVTTEGKEKSATGHDIIQPSQLSVVANSAEVEILLFDKNEIAFFPEDVQREIVIGLRKSTNLERPYTEAEMATTVKEFGKWEVEKQRVML